MHPIPERLAPGVMVSSRRHEPRCRAGWAALVRWPDGSDGWYVYSARHVRPAAGR